LILADNKFTGDIPAAVVEGCSLLEEVRLENNQLTGELPAAVAKLKKCKHLVFYRNQLSGPLPELSALRQLLMLDLFSNALTGSIPESIGGCKRLTTLNLANNQFTGPLPEGLGKVGSQ
jgi:Leucine-rich repeat (LRR) protein